MTQQEFLSNCIAHGGNLSAMLMSGIERVFPATFEALPDVTYEFGELSWIVDCLLDDTQQNDYICPRGRRRWVFDGHSLSMYALTPEECAMPIADLYNKYGLEW